MKEVATDVISNEVDDDIHFYNHCTHFLEARKTLFDLINKSNGNFQSLSSFQKNFWTFNCENIDILNNLSIFLLESGVTTLVLIVLFLSLNCLFLLLYVIESSLYLEGP